MQSQPTYETCIQVSPTDQRPAVDAAPTPAPIVAPPPPVSLPPLYNPAIAQPAQNREPPQQQQQTADRPVCAGSMCILLYVSRVYAVAFVFPVTPLLCSLDIAFLLMTAGAMFMIMNTQFTPGCIPVATGLLCAYAMSAGLALLSQVVCNRVVSTTDVVIVFLSVIYVFGSIGLMVAFGELSSCFSANDFTLHLVAFCAAECRVFLSFLSSVLRLDWKHQRHIEAMRGPAPPRGLPPEKLAKLGAKRWSDIAPSLPNAKQPRKSPPPVLQLPQAANADPSQPADAPVEQLAASVAAALDVKDWPASPTSPGECCAVCLESFKAESIVKRLPGCSHVFHSACIDTWLTIQNRCPSCRQQAWKSPTAASAQEQKQVVVVV